MGGGMWLWTVISVLVVVLLVVVITKLYNKNSEFIAVCEVDC